MDPIIWSSIETLDSPLRSHEQFSSMQTGVKFQRPDAQQIPFKVSLLVYALWDALTIRNK